LLVCLVDRLLPFGPIDHSINGTYRLSTFFCREPLLAFHLTNWPTSLSTDDLTEPKTTFWRGFSGRISYIMQQYGTRDAAEALAERLNERSASDSLEGNSQFLMSAEVVEEDGVFWIRADLLHPNADGWKPVI
jgi:hypothetical protein